MGRMQPNGVEPVIVVGAGVGGLACARALHAAGRSVIVLERARGVGGRCATRRVEGVPMDFGPTFLHGRTPEFLEALAGVPAQAISGWPMVVAGQGQPCQPAAFTPGEQRFAFAEGVTAFPRHLAKGLDVRLEQRVTRMTFAGARVLLETEGGEEYQSSVVVLALAAEQTRALLQTVAAPPPEIRGAAALLGLAHSQATLALLALYGEEAPELPWQLCLPRESKVLHLIANESSKRPTPAKRAVLFQARPAWSREHLDDAQWPAQVLEEAGRTLGAWAARPLTHSAHRWTWARNGRDSELTGPLLLSAPEGALLGVCGDRFAPGGGVEAAFTSGRALAARILTTMKGTS